MKKDYTDPATLRELKKEYEGRKMFVENFTHAELLEFGFVHYEEIEISGTKDLFIAYDFLMKEEFYEEVIFTKIEGNIEVYAKKQNQIKTNKRRWSENENIKNITWWLWEYG